ncbi:Derlin 1 [Linnemannia gamsii]|uniref:Derlin n=1 Tax=Linnemannia gamsii TaxID=64522 RepID=A0ABQ7JMS6_9FUNG|nr:Derlin 1 [Linnemannia gamsii]
MPENELVAAYKSVPIITRTMLTATTIISIGVAVHLVSFNLVYLNWSLIFYRFQIQRLFTPFFYTGVNFSFLFDLYFLYTYGTQLENSTYAGRSADFAWFIIFTSISSSIVAHYMGYVVLFQSLLLSVIYLWSQANSDRIVSFMFGVQFKAVYFPWVLVAYNAVMMGAVIPWTMLIGIASAHLYYFLDSVYPAMGGPKLIPTPGLLYRLLPAQEVAGAGFTAGGGTASVLRAAGRQGGTAAAETAGHRWGTGNRLG